MNESKEQDKIDELLDRIKDLTPDEKALLDRLSKGGKLESEKKPENKPPVKKYGGDDPRDFLNRILGTNIGPETQITQIGPGEDYSMSLTTGGLQAPKKSSNFKEGDRVTYVGNMKEFKGKKAKYLRAKEDGKCSIQFDDGKKLVVKSNNIVPSKLDPYGEERWEEDKPIVPKRRRANPDEPWWNGGDNPRDEYCMINRDNVPSDFYFHVDRFDNITTVIMTSAEFFHQNHCCDDSLGSHNLSQNVINALNRCGVVGEVELMEGMWEARPGRTVQQVTQSMIQEGFIHDQDFINFLEEHNH